MRSLATREIGTVGMLLGAAGSALSLGVGHEGGAWISGVVVPIAAVLLKFALELNKSSQSNRDRDNRQDEEIRRLDIRVSALEGKR